MFRQRSYQKEILDAADIPKEMLYRNLQELNVVNAWLGGHAVSIAGLKAAITDKEKHYHIVDIGCGGGDSLNAIAEWSAREDYKIYLTGIDLKQDCIDYAHSQCKDHVDISFRCDDFRNAFHGEAKVDIVHAALFCHHFTEAELIPFIKTCSDNGAIFLANDLERHPVAYYSIKALTRLLSRSPLVKNDAPLSVMRGFKRQEWESILQKAGIKKYTISNRWAFRHLVIAYPNG